MDRRKPGKPTATQPTYGAESPEYSQPDPSAIRPEEYPSLPTPDESQRLDRIYHPAPSAGDNTQQPNTAQPSSHHVPATVRPKSQRQMKAEAGKKKKRSKSKSRGTSNSSNISTGQQHTATPEVGSNVTVSTSASDSSTDQPITADAVTTPTPPAPGGSKVNTKYPTTSTTNTAVPAYQLIAISSTTSTADDAMDTNVTADVALPEKQKKDILKVKINKKKRTHDEPTDMVAKRCQNTTPTTATTTPTAAPSESAVSTAVVATVANTNISGNLTTSTTTTHNPKPRGKGNQIQMATISTGAANDTSLQSGTKESSAGTAAARRCGATSAEEAVEAVSAPTDILIAASVATTASSQMIIDNTPKTLTLIDNILEMQSENNGQPDVSMLPTSQSTDHSDRLDEHGSQQLSQQTETIANNSHMKCDDGNNNSTEKGQPIKQNICDVDSSSTSEGEVECIGAPQGTALMSAANVKIPQFDPDTVSDDELGDVLLALKQRRVLAYQEAVNQLPCEIVRQYNQLEEDVNRRWRLMDQKLEGKPEPPPYPNHPALTLPPAIPNADDQTVVPAEPTFPRRRHKYHLALETTTATALRLTSDEEFSDDDYTGKLEWMCKPDWAMGAPNQGVLALRPEARERMINKQFELVCFTDMKIHCLRGDVRHYNDATRRGYFMFLLTKLNRRVPLGKGKILYYIKTQEELDIAALIIWCSKKNHIACHIQPFTNDEDERTKGLARIKQQQHTQAIPNRISKFVSPQLLANNNASVEILRILCLGIREGVVLAIEAEGLTYGLSAGLEEVLCGKLFIKTWWDMTKAQQMWAAFFSGHHIQQPFPEYNSHCMSRMIALRCIRQPKDITSTVTSLYPCPDIQIEIKPSSLNAPIGQFRDTYGRLATDADKLLNLGKSIIAHVSAHWSILMCLGLKHVNRPINPFNATHIDDIEIMAFQLLDGQPILQDINNSETLSQAVLEELLTEAARRHSAITQHNTEQVASVYSTTTTGHLCNETGSIEPPLTLNTAVATIHEEIRRTVQTFNKWKFSHGLGVPIVLQDQAPLEAWLPPAYEIKNFDGSRKFQLRYEPHVEKGNANMKAQLLKWPLHAVQSSHNMPTTDELGPLTPGIERSMIQDCIGYESEKHSAIFTYPGLVRELEKGQGRVIFPSRALHEVKRKCRDDRRSETITPQHHRQQMLNDRYGLNNRSLSEDAQRKTLRGPWFLQQLPDGTPVHHYALLPQKVPQLAEKIITKQQKLAISTWMRPYLVDHATKLRKNGSSASASQVQRRRGPSRSAKRQKSPHTPPPPRQSRRQQHQEKATPSNAGSEGDDDDSDHDEEAIVRSAKRISQEVGPSLMQRLQQTTKAVSAKMAQPMEDDVDDSAVHNSEQVPTTPGNLFDNIHHDKLPPGTPANGVPTNKTQNTGSGDSIPCAQRSRSNIDHSASQSLEQQARQPAATNRSPTNPAGGEVNKQHSISPAQQSGYSGMSDVTDPGETSVTKSQQFPHNDVTPLMTQQQLITTTTNSQQQCATSWPIPPRNVFVRHQNPNLNTTLGFSPQTATAQQIPSNNQPRQCWPQAQQYQQQTMWGQAPTPFTGPIQTIAPTAPSLGAPPYYQQPRMPTQQTTYFSTGIKSEWETKDFQQNSGSLNPMDYQRRVIEDPGTLQQRLTSLYAAIQNIASAGATIVEAHGTDIINIVKKYQDNLITLSETYKHISPAVDLTPLGMLCTTLGEAIARQRELGRYYRDMLFDINARLDGLLIQAQQTPQYPSGQQAGTSAPIVPTPTPRASQETIQMIKKLINERFSTPQPPQSGMLKTSTTIMPTDVIKQDEQQQQVPTEPTAPQHTIQRPPTQQQMASATSSVVVERVPPTGTPQQFSQQLITNSLESKAVSSAPKTGEYIDMRGVDGDSLSTQGTGTQNSINTQASQQLSAATTTSTTGPTPADTHQLLDIHRASPRSESKVATTKQSENRRQEAVEPPEEPPPTYDTGDPTNPPQQHQPSPGWNPQSPTPSQTQQQRGRTTKHQSAKYQSGVSPSRSRSNRRHSRHTLRQDSRDDDLTSSRHHSKRRRSRSGNRHSNRDDSYEHSRQRRSRSDSRDGGRSPSHNRSKSRRSRNSNRHDDQNTSRDHSSRGHSRGNKRHDGQNSPHNREKQYSPRTSSPRRTASSSRQQGPSMREFDAGASTSRYAAPNQQQPPPPEIQLIPTPPPQIPFDQPLWEVTNHPALGDPNSQPIVPRTELENKQDDANQFAQYHYQWYRYDNTYQVPSDPDPRRLEIDRDEQYWIRQSTQPAFFQYTRRDDEYMRPESGEVTNRRVLREVTALLERAPTGTWTIHLPMHLATGYPRQRTQHLQLRAMDMYFTVSRRKFDNHNQETTMEVHQTALEIRVYLQTLPDNGETVTFLMFAKEVTRHEAGLRDLFLRCEVCEGVSILLLYTKYENLIRHLVWQLHLTLSAAMTSLQSGVERVDPLIRLPLNEYPDLDTETPITKKERRRQRKMVCANELRDTSLVNSQVARDIRELYRLGQAWQQNQRHWAINIQVARAAQIRQLAHWVQRMLTVYVNANDVPEILHGLLHDWTEEQTQGAIQAHIHQTPLQCHNARNQQMLASQQYNNMTRVNAARLLPPVVPPPVTPPLPPLNWANVPVIRYQRRELLPANQQQQPIAPYQPALPNPAKETPKQLKEQGSTDKANNGKYPPGNQQQPKSKSVHQRIGQSNIVPEQDQQQRGYTPHSTDEEARRSITPANQQRRREDGEVSSNNEYRPPPTGSIEMPHGSSRPQAQQQLQSNSTRVQQPRFGGQWIGLQPGQGYSSDYGPPGSNRPPSRRTYRPPQDGHLGRDGNRDRNGRDRDRRDKTGSSTSRRDSRDKDGRDKGSGRWTPDPEGQ